jgi:hypothetical protein
MMVMIKTGYRYYFPALSFRAAPLKERIRNNPDARKVINQASEVLRDDLFRIFESGQPFSSNRQCYLATLAAHVAATKIPLSEGKYPSVLVCSSFGHYAGLVTAGVLDFSNTLYVLSDIGAAFDNYYSEYKTYQIKTSLPAASPFPLETKLIQFSLYYFILNFSEDGIFLTCRQYISEEVVKMAVERNVKNVLDIEPILPARPPYHSPLFQEAEQQSHIYIEELKIKLPDPCPVILSSYSDTGLLPQDKAEILNTLKCFMSGKHYLDKLVERIAEFEDLNRVNIRPFAKN